MVWFSEQVLTTDMVLQHYLQRMRAVTVEEESDSIVQSQGQFAAAAASVCLSECQSCH